jgi:hypothetical protein
MVVDYRKVNAKVVFYSYPMPTTEQTFQQFGGALVFSVLDLTPRITRFPFLARAGGLPIFAPYSACTSLINRRCGLV